MDSKRFLKVNYPFDCTEASYKAGPGVKPGRLSQTSSTSYLEHNLKVTTNIFPIEIVCIIKVDGLKEVLKK